LGRVPQKLLGVDSSMRCITPAKNNAEYIKEVKAKTRKQAI